MRATNSTLIGKAISYTRKGNNGAADVVITDVIAERRGSNYYNSTNCLIAKTARKGLEAPRSLSQYYVSNTGANLHKSYTPELTIS